MLFCPFFTETNVSFKLICSIPDLHVLQTHQREVVVRDHARLRELRSKNRGAVPTVYISPFCVIHRNLSSVFLVFTPVHIRCSSWWVVIFCTESPRKPTRAGHREKKLVKFLSTLSLALFPTVAASLRKRHRCVCFGRVTYTGQCVAWSLSFIFGFFCSNWSLPRLATVQEGSLFFVSMKRQQSPRLIDEAHDPPSHDLGRPRS